MTTIDIHETFAAAGEYGPKRPGLLARLIANWRIRRMQRIALRELSRMDEHLLRDIGIAPMDVIDALEGRRSSVLLNPLRKG